MPITGDYLTDLVIVVLQERWNRDKVDGKVERKAAKQSSEVFILKDQAEDGMFNGSRSPFSHSAENNQDISNLELLRQVAL